MMNSIQHLKYYVIYFSKHLHEAISIVEMRY